MLKSYHLLHLYIHSLFACFAHNTTQCRDCCNDIDLGKIDISFSCILMKLYNAQYNIIISICCSVRTRDILSFTIKQCHGLAKREHDSVKSSQSKLELCLRSVLLIERSRARFPLTQIDSYLLFFVRVVWSGLEQVRSN